MSQATLKYINRELSWLEFNDRVLQEARDENAPLLERLKFLAISGSNLDEFFMVRVGGLQMLSKRGRNKRDPAGLTPEDQLQAISRRVHQMTADQHRCLLYDLEPHLAQEDLRRVRPGQLTEHQGEVVQRIFEDEIYPVLTPMAVTSVDDFPLLIGGALGVCARLAPASEEDQVSRYAVIPFGRASHRFITLPSDGAYEYILLEDVVAMFIDAFFPGEQIAECIPFRITRNADLSVREDLAADLLAEMEDILDARKQSHCVRLEISDAASDTLLGFLKQSLSTRDEDVYAVPGPLDLSAYMRLAELQRFEHLRRKHWPPQASPNVDLTASTFDVLAQDDVLLLHPYESFEPVLRFIEEAADDPDVLAIKQILYRTSRKSPIVAALRRAAQQGKYVTAIVELKARFDEARNIEWAKDLERAGVQVIYGVKGFKTHGKVCIVVRREPHGIRRYVHFGTGNYNEITAQLYGDVSLMTCDEHLGADATNFFNAITGYSRPQRFHKIDAAPIGLREKLLELIAIETEQKRHGQRAHIMAKMNSLVDPKIINALYTASQAGVKIDLNVRGVCCLRPGLKGISENIRVVSIVDRFLEHARIFYFHHDGDQRVYISSADWMPRNLDRRVELFVPVEAPSARKRLIGVLESCLQDNVKSHELLPDGTYRRLTPPEGQEGIRSQEVLYQQACEAVRQSEQLRRTVFEPHRAPGTDS